MFLNSILTESTGLKYIIIFLFNLDDYDWIMSLIVEKA